MSAAGVLDVGAATASPVLRLDGDLSIYRAAEVKSVILAALDQRIAHFDLSEVTEIDTAGVQVLLLARREAVARGMDLQLGAASSAVRSAFTLLELDSHLAVA